MKASELMIGDFLRYKQNYPYTHLQGKIVKVYGIIGRVDVITIDDGNFHESEHPDWLEPIPLTPEILEKNGFIRDGESWWYQDFRIVLSTSNGVSLVCGRQMRFQYVHQLQQTFRLCGIEKEITI